MKANRPSFGASAAGRPARKRSALALSGISVAAMTLSAVLLCACSTSAERTLDSLPVAPEIVEARGRYLKQYVLMPGDKIEVSVWQVPEYSRIVQVRPDGKISIPTVSNIQAAGLTFEELEGQLTVRLADRLRNPLVTVIAVDIRSSQVFVLGDVATQRPVPLRDAPTALEAIALAGGLRRTADAAEVSIIRLGDDGVLRAIPIDVTLNGQPANYMAMTVMRLQPDDIVFVPESRRSEAVRWLDDFVSRPLSYLASSLLSYRILDNNLQ